MRIAIATDAWLPQTNGVVTTLKKTAEVLKSQGHEVLMLTPEPFRTIPLPTYKSIRLAILPGRKIRKMLDTFAPEAVHIATEGPVGLSTRSYCIKNELAFTTSYHTQFPQYIRLRAPIPMTASYKFLRWFHSAARRTLVPTESQRQELLKWNFNNVVIWSRGVDTGLFRPQEKSTLSDVRPISMFVGRVAVEKSVEDFLSLDIPGTKYVVGDGPDLEAMKNSFPDARFTGFRYGEELAQLIASADVFVFPSRTDTFGLVMLEAMSCGVPVAAYPVTGPIDVIDDGVTGILSDDLREATLKALELDPADARSYALAHSWNASTEQFYDHLEKNNNIQQAQLQIDSK